MILIYLIYCNKGCLPFFSHDYYYDMTMFLTICKRACFIHHEFKVVHLSSVFIGKMCESNNWVWHLNVNQWRESFCNRNGKQDPRTCNTTISRKKRFAACWNCSYRLRGKKVRGVYLQLCTTLSWKQNRSVKQ